MAREDEGPRRRGPPRSTRDRAPPQEDTEEEWYGDVVDESDESGGFSSFRVKRPQMHHVDQSEGEQWERYFDKQYHSKADEKRSDIEDGWDETDEPSIGFTSVLAGYRILNLGIQSIMFALPMLVMSFVLVFAGNSAHESMDNSTGKVINILFVISALCLITIALIQIVVQSVNQSIHNRSLIVEGPDVPLLNWISTIKLSCGLFAEMLLTFVAVWSVELIGLYMLAGGVPEITLPSIDSDTISAGSILYMLGAAGSLIALIGVLPYTIQATIERVD